MTLNEINQKFTDLCANLGFKNWQMSVLERQIKRDLKEAAELNQLASAMKAAQEKEQKQAEESKTETT